MRTCWLVIILWCLSVPVSGGVGEWKTYTSKKQVRHVYQDLADSGICWIATSGGLLRYRHSVKKFDELTTSEGLRTNDISTLSGESDGTLWIGGTNGILHRYFPATGGWEYFTQIADDKDHGPEKTISSLYVFGDTLFIISEIGVSLLSISDGTFLDNYLHSAVDNASSFLIKNGIMYVGTDNGVAYTSLSNPNPSAPDLWSVYTTASGLPSDHINDIAILEDRIVVCTDNGIAISGGTVWSIIPNTTDLDVLEMITGESMAFCITDHYVYSFTTVSPVETVQYFPEQLSTIGKPWILGTLNNGIIAADNGSWSNIPTPGPPSNKFVGIAIDQDGILWAGTGARNGEGFMRFDGFGWKQYTLNEYPDFVYNDFYKVSVAGDNEKWISGWGAGIVKVDRNGVVGGIYNTTNGIPPCIPTDPHYAVVGGVAEDRSGVIWITSRTPPGDTILTQYQPNESFTYLSGCILGKCAMRNPNNVFTDVLIDYYGTKWFANYSRFETEPPNGFYYYNENGTVPGTSLGWGKLTTADGLTSDKVWSLALDREGGVWVGSDQGISIIFNPAYPRASISPYHPLRDQVIQSIAVDECDNKWIATKRGVFLLSPDGTSILDQYTVESTNGKLLNDDVNSLAINHKTGMVYMGTESGLSALKTSAVTPASSYSEMVFSPNPFFIPGSNTLTIDGLVRSSSVKILSMSGKVVREFRCPCGRIGFWDGKDDEGNYAATGIYLIVAYAEDGNTVATGKLAVIRK